MSEKIVVKRGHEHGGNFVQVELHQSPFSVLIFSSRGPSSCPLPFPFGCWRISCWWLLQNGLLCPRINKVFSVAASSCDKEATELKLNESLGWVAFVPIDTDWLLLLLLMLSVGAEAPADKEESGRLEVHSESVLVVVLMDSTEDSR